MGLIVFHKIFLAFSLNMNVFYGILSVPQNIVMDMNNVTRVYRIYIVYIRKHRDMSTCNWLDLETLGP